MLIVALAVLMSAQLLYSMDSKPDITEYVFSVIKQYGSPMVKCCLIEYEKINQGLVELVDKNNVVGREYHPDGRNLGKIKAYLEQHKNKIDFNFIAGSGYTALMRACYLTQCSEQVVQLFCDNGANPNKGLCYPGTQCLHPLAGASDSATAIIKLQLDKFAILKAAAKQKGQKLFLNKNGAVDSLRDREEYKELFIDTEVPTGH